MLTMELTAFSNIALHATIEWNRSTFVVGLLNIMNTEDLEIMNLDGDTTFCMVATVGNEYLLQTMLEKNDNLTLISRHHGRLQVHLATLSGYHRTMQGLSSGNLLDRMTYKAIELLFFMTISSGIYGKTNRNYHTYLPQRNIATN